MQDQVSSVITTTIRIKVQLVTSVNHNTNWVYNLLSIFKLMGIFSGIHKLTVRLTSLRCRPPISSILRQWNKCQCSYLTIITILHSTVIITIIQIVHLAIASNRTTTIPTTMAMAVTAIATTTIMVEWSTLADMRSKFLTKRISKLHGKS